MLYSYKVCNFLDTGRCMSWENRSMGAGRNPGKQVGLWRAAGEGWPVLPSRLPRSSVLEFKKATPSSIMAPDRAKQSGPCTLNPEGGFCHLGWLRTQSLAW